MVLLLVAVVMALGALGVLALGTASLLNLGPFASTEPAGLEVTDPVGDCREAGLDRGESCDAGADIEAIKLRYPDDHTLSVELVLTEAPALGPGRAWTAEFYVEAANTFTDGGVICRRGPPCRAGLVARPRPEHSAQTDGGCRSVRWSPRRIRGQLHRGRWRPAHRRAVPGDRIGPA